MDLREPPRHRAAAVTGATSRRRRGAPEAHTNSTPSTRRHESHRRGVNATQYNPGKRSKSLRAKFGADDSNVVVLWAARLVPEKGADLFADAFVALFNNKTLLEHYDEKFKHRDKLPDMYTQTNWIDMRDDMLTIFVV